MDDATYVREVDYKTWRKQLEAIIYKQQLTLEVLANIIKAAQEDDDKSLLEWATTKFDTFQHMLYENELSLHMGKTFNKRKMAVYGIMDDGTPVLYVVSKEMKQRLEYSQRMRDVMYV